MSCAILAQAESIASFSFDNTFLAFSSTFCKSFVCSLLDSVIQWVSTHQRCCLQYSATVCTAPPMATPHWEQLLLLLFTFFLNASIKYLWLLSKRTNKRSYYAIARNKHWKPLFWRWASVCVFIVEFISVVIATIWSRHHSVVNRTFDHVERRKERRWR